MWVLTGPDRIDLGALIFPDIEACRTLAGNVVGDAASVVANSRVRDEFRKRLIAFTKEATGASTRLARIMLMAEPPSMDAGEATDKGSINQRNVLRHRATLVNELYALSGSPRVFTPK